ncbi:MAG: class I SAM-dependent methyltransferase [Bacteriovoracaceae bacterium]|nr:class I SAM-dependent methyltransferase [Bacteriovoracaceae bacterium]
MKSVWDKRYSEEGFAYGEAPNDFLAEHYARIKPNGNVLCIAEGEGRNALFLARKGFNVTAVDFSEVGMSKAKNIAAKENLPLETIVSDLEVFDLGKAKWDAVISIFAHLPPTIRKIVHARIETSLKDNGILILEAYRPEQLELGTGGPPKRDMMMNLEILKMELPHLKPELGKELERNIHEGKYHNGRSAVVQYIGKK